MAASKAKTETNSQPSLSDPVNVGTHPDSFSPVDLENDFQPTNDNKLDIKRWLANEFFESRGPSHSVRLDDLRHGPDASDRDLAREIIMRAGLADHPRTKELVDRFARALSDIENPRKWINPLKDVS